MFRMIATTPANLTAAPIGSGLTAGTRVETSTGWRAVETLRMGDLVHTWDGGLRPIMAIDRAQVGPRDQMPCICIPGGVLDTCSDLILPARQPVLLETHGDDRLPDAACVLVPALALVGWQGITRLTPAAVELITPVFEAEEILWANSGALLRCPGMVEGAQGAVRSDFTSLDLNTAWAFLGRHDRLRQVA
jgi:hypothetical protein